MKPEEIKSLPVAASTHHRVKLLAAQQKLEMKVLVSRAIDVYETDSQSSNQGKGRQSAVDRQLEVINRTSPELARRFRDLIAAAAEELQGDGGGKKGSQQ